MATDDGGPRSGTGDRNFWQKLEPNVDVSRWIGLHQHGVHHSTRLAVEGRRRDPWVRIGQNPVEGDLPVDFARDARYRRQNRETNCCGRQQTIRRNVRQEFLGRSDEVFDEQKPQRKTEQMLQQYFVLDEKLQQ